MFNMRSDKYYIMKIYELLKQSPTQQLQDINQAPPQNPEDDQNGKFSADQVDNDLQQASSDINDQNAMPEPMGGAEPQDPELDNQNIEPLDDVLMAQIRTLPYSTRYEFDDKSPLNPIRIAGMEIADLSNLANMVKVKMQTQILKNPIGNDDNDTLQYCNDLLRFINVVMKFKKSSTSDQLSKTRPAPSYQKTPKKQ
jgi:hypothetical protein